MGRIRMAVRGFIPFPRIAMRQADTAPALAQ